MKNSKDTKIIKDKVANCSHTFTVYGQKMNGKYYNCCCDCKYEYEFSEEEVAKFKKAGLL